MLDASKPVRNIHECSFVSVPAMASSSDRPGCCVDQFNTARSSLHQRPFPTAGAPTAAPKDYVLPMVDLPFTAEAFHRSSHLSITFGLGLSQLASPCQPHSSAMRHKMVMICHPSPFLVLAQRPWPGGICFKPPWLTSAYLLPGVLKLRVQGSRGTLRDR
jgi:hypothetical protein